MLAKALLRLSPPGCHDLSILTVILTAEASVAQHCFMMPTAGSSRLVLTDKLNEFA